MNKLLAIACFFTTFIAHAQEDLNQKTQPIVAEGRRLYKSEMASWHGTDIFMEKIKDRNKIGGYFSYVEGAIAKCVFYGNDEVVKVIGTITFDTTYNLANAKTDFSERKFNRTEQEYYDLQNVAYALVKEDSLFETYEETNFNLVPLIDGNERKVYVLTGTNKQDVVRFGNDYLITFDKHNKITGKRALHKNLIPVEFAGKTKENKNVIGSMHNHLPSTGDFITATDVCTIMLYEKIAKWEQHIVVTPKYMCIWHCSSNVLTTVPKDVLEKIYNKD